MEKEAVDKIDQLLRDLAEQLGTTSEYLWGVLVRQAPIEAIFQLLWMGGSLAGLLFCVIKATHLMKSEEFKNDEAAPVVSLALCLMGMIVLTLTALSSFDSIMIGGFLNPEYYALREILEALK